MARPLMGWIAARKVWQKRYKGKLYLVSCRQLEAPPTKEGSIGSANAWWLAKQADIDQQARPPIGYHTDILTRCNAYADSHGLEGRFMVWNDEEKDRWNWGAISDEARAVWYDRIKGRTTTATGSLDKLVQRYLDGKRMECEAGQLSVGRWDNLCRWLTQWRKWIGDIDPYSLNGVQLEAYQHHLLKLIADKKTSQATAKSNLATMKEFLRWLYRSEIIDRLPRNMDDVNIGVSPKKVKTLTVEYIKELITRATARENSISF